MDDLSQKHILIAGLARNSAGTITHSVAQLRDALKPFKSLQWLVIESDSGDDTLGALENLQALVPGFRFISHGRLRDKLRLRTERIAYCRNSYLDEMEKNPAYAHIDYLVVADLDGANDLISRDAVRSCWARDDWDVCTANQRGAYYDIWALRHDLWCPNDCWEQQKFLEENGVEPEQARYVAVYSKMIAIPENAEWIEVKSAFGGFALYRRKALAGASYTGLDDTGREICEHVTLHRDLVRKGCRLFINPRLINASAINHTDQRNFLPSVKRRLKRRISTMLGPERVKKIKSLIDEE